ncbi:hypothetical protein D3C74_319590 [compost metagenome]
MPTSPISAVGLSFSASNLAISSALDISVSVCVISYLAVISFQVSFQLAQESGMPTLTTAPSLVASASISLKLSSLAGALPFPSSALASELAQAASNRTSKDNSRPMDKNCVNLFFMISLSLLFLIYGLHL